VTQYKNTKWSEQTAENDCGHVMYVCMYVCMSENLYPARLKQKSHSRAAVSNKQKRLQCPF